MTALQALMSSVTKEDQRAKRLPKSHDSTLTKEIQVFVAWLSTRFLFISLCTGCFVFDESWIPHYISRCPSFQAVSCLAISSTPEDSPLHKAVFLQGNRAAMESSGNAFEVVIVFKYIHILKIHILKSFAHYLYHGLSCSLSGYLLSASTILKVKTTSRDKSKNPWSCWDYKINERDNWTVQISKIFLLLYVRFIFFKKNI